jgi:hypothetical protein
MNACKAMRATNLGKPGETVGEVAEGGASRNSNQAECRNRDAPTRVKAVQQEHQSSDGYGRDCE